MKHFCSFSEAIREGARMTPQGSIYMLLDEAGGTCAIGAGAVAIGLPTEKCPYEFLASDATLAALRKMYPYLWESVTSPAANREYDVLNVIADLFDVYGWTREQIADWLESEEEKLGYVTLTEQKDQVAVCGSLLSI